MECGSGVVTQSSDEAGSSFTSYKNGYLTILLHCLELGSYVDSYNILRNNAALQTFKPYFCNSTLRFELVLQTWKLKCDEVTTRLSYVSQLINDACLQTTPPPVLANRSRSVRYTGITHVRAA